MKTCKYILDLVNATLSWIMRSSLFRTLLLSSKVTRDETRRAAYDVNNRHTNYLPFWSEITHSFLLCLLFCDIMCNCFKIYCVDLIPIVLFQFSFLPLFYYQFKLWISGRVSKVKHNLQNWSKMQYIFSYPSQITTKIANN